ncbi:unnamed protein product, partial [Brassica rapa]
SAPSDGGLAIWKHKAWGNNSGWAVAVIGLLEQGSRS